MRSFRYNRLVQFIKPPDPTINLNYYYLKKMVDGNNYKQMLDIGCGNRRLSDNIINFDIESNSNIDIVGDGHFLPFKNEIYDLVICQAVLEHVNDPHKILSEINKCLKYGGTLYVEIPFLQGFHGDPYDYQRFTLNGLLYLVRDFEVINYGVNIGPFSSLSWWLRKLPTIFIKNNYLNLIFEFFSGWLFFWIKYFDLIFIFAKNKHVLACGIYVTVKKTGKLI